MKSTPVSAGVLLVCLLAPAIDSATGAETRPNFVIILTDDQGWGDLSVHGNTNLSTPNIDSLARDGALFERFFVCPVCSPTRAEFLTGRYHPRSGVHSTSTGGERLDLDEHTVAEAFRAAGYATAAFGKWHNGLQYPYHPTARGFEEYFGFCSGHWGEYFAPELDHNGRLTRGEGFLIDDFTNHALAFIEANRTRPFFCYLPFNTPHSPLQVPDEYWERFRDKQLTKFSRSPATEDIETTRAVLAMCENIDWNVGRILKKLDELQLAENTVVIYFTDNGPNSDRWNGEMKGRKGSTDEGGVRVPLLLRWPREVDAGMRIPQIAAAIDLLPTLTDMANIPRVGDQPLDGVSLQPLLLNPAVAWRDRLLFQHWNGKVSVRSQQYRLDHTGQLFDMLADPSQKQDVAGAQPEIAGRLSQAVTQWKKELLPGLTNDQRPFPVGYRELPITYLPARDGVPHGNVQRSARAPNCSYFTNWASTDDRITWDVEVATAGQYEAAIYYTCPAADVGSTIELRFGDRVLSGQVTPAHDPPLIGADDDRVVRHGESYVKDFRPLRLGVWNLEPGRSQLTLQATKIAGRQVMDVRYVVLTLLTPDA